MPKQPKNNNQAQDQPTQDVNRGKGRPTIFSKTLVETFCELIENGKTLREITSLPEMPAITTLFRWLREEGDEYEDFRQRYTRAREAQADFELDEIRDLVKDATPKDAHVVRLQVDARKFRIEKMAPKKYGKHIQQDVKHSGSVEVQVVDRFGGKAKVVKKSRAATKKPRSK